MGWKDWSYTKRGVIIGGGIGLISSIFGFFGLMLPDNESLIRTLFLSIGAPFILIYIGVYFLVCGYGKTGLCDYISMSIGFILVPIILSLIGAIICFIIRKIKIRSC